MEYHLFVTMTAFLSLITPKHLVVSQADYHHMELVMQWPPTFCARSGNCITPLPMDFTLHGLWPANSSGITLKCDPPSTDTVVWRSDRNLEQRLHLIWPSLIRGRLDSVLWQHEWRSHGYCSSETLSDYEYFKAAVSLTNIFQKKPIVGELAKNKSIFPRDGLGYAYTQIQSAISNQSIYISCKTDATNNVFLHEIIFCLDTMLQNFIACPADLDTRGCGGKLKKSNIIFPKKANFVPSWRSEDVKV